MNTNELNRIFSKINSNQSIKKDLLTLSWTIKDAKKFNLKAFLKSAYKNANVKKAFNEDKDGIILSFKFTKDGKKTGHAFDHYDLESVVRDAVDEVFPGKYSNMETFPSTISGNKYQNILCF